MKTEIHIPVNDAFNISLQVLEHLSAVALEKLISEANMELEKRLEFEGR